MVVIMRLETASGNIMIYAWEFLFNCKLIVCKAILNIDSDI